MSQRGRRGGSKAGASDAMAGGRSQRQLRVGEEMRHVLSDVLRQAHFRDPDLAGLIVTVTEVRVSPDLKNATAFVMPLAGEQGGKIVAALNRAQAYIRGQVAQHLNLRFAATLSFKLDKSFDTAHQIDEVLHRPEVQADLHKDAADTDDKP